jgi:hypothetical protein
LYYYRFVLCQVQLNSAGSGSAGDAALEMELAEGGSDGDEEGERVEESAVAKKNAKIRAENARQEALEAGAARPASQTLGEKAG